MLPISLSFEATDAMVSQAARESWIGLGQRLFGIGTLARMGLVAVIFWAGVRAGTPRPWLLLFGAGPGLLAVLALGWVSGLWWAGAGLRAGS